MHWLAICLSAFGQLVQVSAAPDLIIENARIWSDGRIGFAEFAVINNGRFVYVGPRREELIGGPSLDARGRVVIPGMVDSHIHMIRGGEQLLKLYLRDATDRNDFVHRVADWAQTLPPEKWILGGRWSTESWTNPEQPTKDWIDEAAGDHPLFLPRMDGHSALVSSAALRRAGITAAVPPDPPGGVIDRDPASGEPTGILRDSAMALVASLIPEPTLEDRVLALRRAAKHALKHGITAVSDIPNVRDMPAYRELGRSRPPLRFFLYITADDWSQTEAARRSLGFGWPGWIELHGFKAYFDGSLGSRTAYMHDPFLGNEPHRADWRGLLRAGIEDGSFQRNAAAVRDMGMQTIAHAIGDEANHLLLDMLEQIYGDGLNGARCRAEHVQHLRPNDIARFGALGVIASMQPFHKADDGRYAEQYLGAERCRSSYTYKSLLDTGAVLVFGSDWPVVSLNPFLGIEAAVTGRTLDGRAWQTQENITVGEALRCYTSAGAYAVFAEDQIGRIAPGYRADFVVLNRSPFDPDVDWSAVRPDAVYIEGRLVYGRK